MMEGKDRAVLCVVVEPWAYFTTQSLDQQWGDDWNDAPYEYNAGAPYEFREGYAVEPWVVFKVAYDGPFETPSSGHLNSTLSVEQINAGAAPWLKTSEWRAEGTPCIAIYAGTPFPDFLSLVHAGGGTVYLPVA